MPGFILQFLDESKFDKGDQSFQLTKENVGKLKLLFPTCFIFCIGQSATQNDKKGALLHDASIITAMGHAAQTHACNTLMSDVTFVVHDYHNSAINENLFASSYLIHSCEGRRTNT